MSVRQYIGARYVTKIYENSLDPSSAEWEAGVTYEPLTLVTYNYSSYLSKKAIPGSVGDPASNPAYWVVTGAYNGQIASLQSQIDALQAAINALTPGSKFLYIGDSMLALTDNWGGVIDNILGHTDSTYICDGGAGFHNPGNGTGLNIPGLVQANLGSIPDDVTDVIVFAGCNDCTAANYAYVGNEIATLMTVLRSVLPEARVYFAFNGTFTNGTGSTWNTVRPYINLVYNAINRYVPTHANCYIMNSPSFACLDNSLTSDSTHPTATGSERIAKAMISELNGHEWSLPIRTASSSATKGLSWITCQNNFITLQLLLGGVMYDDAGSPVSVVPHTNVDIGEAQLPLYPRYDNQLSFDCNVRLTAADDTNTYVRASFVIYHDGHLYINVHDGSTVSAKKITIDSFTSYTFPMYE